MTRRIRYQVACSLDGYIAGPDGEFDWIIPEPEFDFAELYARFDTLLMGRKTYEVVRSMAGAFGDKRLIVASRSLRQSDHPDVEIVGTDLKQRVIELRSAPGSDIWLYGGGELFAQLLAWNLVDTVEPAIIPILLGGGLPLLPPPAAQRQLTFEAHRTYPSGMVLLEYAVRPLAGA
ncbi:MAG TPA: dihydrofolate reductase family protein [Longimicrobiales bacterium]|nr:dihydrofolate reductase family protein [Longimicrobiales bacterium]